MGSDSSSSAGISSAGVTKTASSPTGATIQAGGSTVNVVPIGQNVPTQAHSASPKEIQDLADWEAKNYDSDMVLAQKDYIRQEAMKTGFSISQDMNYNLDNGYPLSIPEKIMHANLQRAMHSQNADLVLYRGAHKDLLESLGIKNYQNMSESQLQKALIGTVYQTKSYMSASYDKSKNPFLSGSQAGGREIEMTIKQGAKTQVFLGARKQAEVVSNIGTNYKITGVKFTGRTATPRNSNRSLPVLHLELETI